MNILEKSNIICKSTYTKITQSKDVQFAKQPNLGNFSGRITAEHFQTASISRQTKVENIKRWKNARLLCIPKRNCVPFNELRMKERKTELEKTLLRSINVKECIIGYTENRKRISISNFRKYMYNQLNRRNNDITSKWKFLFIKYMKRTIRLLKNYIPS